MKTKNEIFEDVKKVIIDIVDNEVAIDLSTNLLGDNNIIDSITIMELITWSNDYYKINVIEDDIYLECMKTVSSFVDKIYELQNN